jgi:hypothetical protein
MILLVALKIRISLARRCRNALRVQYRASEFQLSALMDFRVGRDSADPSKGPRPRHPREGSGSGDVRALHPSPLALLATHVAE